MYLPSGFSLGNGFIISILLGFFPVFPVALEGWNPVRCLPSVWWVNKGCATRGRSDKTASI
jgi:hypothetical protein